MTSSAVLNPGRKMKSRVSASVRREASAGAMSPVRWLCSESFGVDAAPIVGDFNDHLVALVIGVQADCSLRGLARFAALFGRFDAVADGIAHQVRQRLGDGVENALVEIGFLSADGEFHLAPALPRDIAHHARKAAEQLVDGHHADLHDRALQDRSARAPGRPSRRRICRAAVPWDSASRIPFSACCSIDLPMINSPTRFRTLSMRPASTRRTFS